MGETLGRFQEQLGTLGTQLTSLSEINTDSLPREHCLALIELVDRVRRLAGAFKEPPSQPWWAGTRHWRQAWETQARGLDILREHAEILLRKEGINRIDVLGQPFDPVMMAANASEPSAQHPHFTVLEEILPGYELCGELLRPAQVKISLNK
jgi:hypothetical protein